VVIEKLLITDRTGLNEYSLIIDRTDRKIINHWESWTNND